MESLQKNLESRIDAIGWGLFFIMSGALLVVPGLPEGIWALGVGAILLACSALRHAFALPVSTFAVICGVVAIVAGVGTMAGAAVSWFGLLLLLCGAAIVIGELARHPQHA